MDITGFNINRSTVKTLVCHDNIPIDFIIVVRCCSGCKLEGKVSSAYSSSRSRIR